MVTDVLHNVLHNVCKCLEPLIHLQTGSWYEALDSYH